MARLQHATQVRGPSQILSFPPSTPYLGRWGDIRSDTSLCAFEPVWVAHVFRYLLSLKLETDACPDLENK